MNSHCKKTMTACFIGYITQAITTNFVPLLYYDFQRQFKIELEKITLIIVLTFLIQFLTDLFASKYVCKIGYRKCLVTAHLLCAIGFVLMTVLPSVMNSFTGIILSVVVYATGSGLLEVIISPVVQSCPTKNKEGIMSFLHSFYCWGVVATVVISTVFFVAFGVKNWRILALIWAIIPLVNAFIFSRVPLYSFEEETIETNYKQLFLQKSFWIMLVLMVCAGACEQAISQWASTITESSLDVSKTTGDLCGVCGFAIMMGLSRLVYAKFSKEIPLKNAILFSAVLCVISFMLIGLAGKSVVALLGFCLCGFSIGIFWPGTFSLSAKNVAQGGTTMFALLALAGDIGCTGGPALVGKISSFYNGNFGMGILMTAIFPIAMIAALLFLKSNEQSESLVLPVTDD